MRTRHLLWLLALVTTAVLLACTPGGGSYGEGAAATTVAPDANVPIVIENQTLAPFAVYVIVDAATFPIGHVEPNSTTILRTRTPVGTMIAVRLVNRTANVRHDSQPILLPPTGLQRYRLTVYPTATADNQPHTNWLAVGGSGR